MLSKAHGTRAALFGRTTASTAPASATHHLQQFVFTHRPTTGTRLRLSLGLGEQERVFDTPQRAKLFGALFARVAVGRVPHRHVCARRTQVRVLLCMGPPTTTTTTTTAHTPSAHSTPLHFSMSQKMNNLKKKGKKKEQKKKKKKEKKKKRKNTQHKHKHTHIPRKTACTRLP